MAASDSIGDALTKIRNASRARHPAVDVRPSKLTAQILELLKREGFIRAYKPVGDTPALRRLRVYLKYVKRTPAITQIVRVSRPGVRAYRRVSELPRVLGGLGLAIISTSKGLLADRDAYRGRQGGEVICYVW